MYSIVFHLPTLANVALQFVVHLMDLAVVTFMLHFCRGNPSAYIADDLVARIVLFSYVLIDAFHENLLFAMRTFRLLVRSVEMTITFLLRCETLDAFHVTTLKFQYIMYQFRVTMQGSVCGELKGTFVTTAKNG